MLYGTVQCSTVHESSEQNYACTSANAVTHTHFILDVRICSFWFFPVTLHTFDLSPPRPPLSPGRVSGFKVSTHRCLHPCTRLTPRCHGLDQHFRTGVRRLSSHNKLSLLLKFACFQQRKSDPSQGTPDCIWGGFESAFSCPNWCNSYP